MSLCIPKRITINILLLICLFTVFSGCGGSTGASNLNVIFLLNVLSNILKDVTSKEEELSLRQVLFDKLNATRIILVLIWNDDQPELDYLIMLLKFFILLMQGGNKQVQKSIYEFFLSSSLCEKFFVKMKNIL